MMWRSLQIDGDFRHFRWITASEICIILHIIWKPLLILGWRNVQMFDYHCRADAVILNVTTPSVAPSSQGTGYSGFQVTGILECGQKSTLPPPQKKKHVERDLVPGYRHRTRILAWVCLKRVHISAQRVLYFGTKCERCISFPRTTKGIGRVCQRIGYLVHWCRIPILIKQNSLLCRHKSWRFLVCCIRRHTDIFRFILIYLIIAS